ncbi:MAG: ABC transporter permease [bacterium]
MNKVGKYIATRLVVAIPMIFVLLTIVFLILRVMPGDPVLSMLGGRNVPQELIEKYRVKLGLNKPLYVQYVEYILNIARGNFGTSSRTGEPVLRDILKRFPATFELAFFSMIIAIVIGLLTGTFASTHSDRAADHGLRVFNVGTFATPIFWLGLMLQIIFGVKLGWLPVGGRLDPIVGASFKPITRFYILDSILKGDVNLLVDTLKHLILPSLTLGVVLSGLIGRITRSNMLEILNKHYISTARSKGLPERSVTYRHALRNALIPIVTVMGLQFAILLAGAILTETTFSWPGLARYLLQSIDARDFNAIQGTIVFIAILISTINLIVDVIYSVLDPRIKY